MQQNNAGTRAVLKVAGAGGSPKYRQQFNRVFGSDVGAGNYVREIIRPRRLEAFKARLRGLPAWSDLFEE